MMTKINEHFEVAIGEQEVRSVSEEYHVPVDYMKTSSEFLSRGLTIGGETVIPRGERGSMTKHEMHKKTEKIPGLYCPDCDAQAFKTDHKNVAVCGDYPGWYFFYRKLDNEKENASKKKLVLRNGQYVEVEADETEVNNDSL